MVLEKLFPGQYYEVRVSASARSMYDTKRILESPYSGTRRVYYSSCTALLLLLHPPHRPKKGCGCRKSTGSKGEQTNGKVSLSGTKSNPSSGKHDTSEITALKHEPDLTASTMTPQKRSNGSSHSAATAAAAAAENGREDFLAGAQFSANPMVDTGYLRDGGLVGVSTWDPVTASVRDTWLPPGPKGHFPADSRFL
ncbi:unnamed protein product [Notodromas monacha]|uniref:Uncharacterized protein n=1 Tax=Notodromas monacha TaxID=399045 RepID=A0A7R9GIN0_9CRUS|nr:unnamed protein product [Notodromas monacha]CAG0921964.1 unnamed protein product [Notodromas monacha]